VTNGAVPGDEIVALRIEGRSRHSLPGVEVVGYDGGQERYAVLFGVE